MPDRSHLLLALLTLAACGPSPDARRAQADMRTALGAGDARRAVELYGSWREKRGDDDPDALRMLATTTLWQGLRELAGDQDAVDPGDRAAGDRGAVVRRRRA